MRPVAYLLLAISCGLNLLTFWIYGWRWGLSTTFVTGASYVLGYGLGVASKRMDGRLPPGE